MKKSASLKFLTWCVCVLFKHQQRDVEEWLQSDACEVGFQHMTDIVSAAVKQKGEEGGSMRVKFVFP
jgi:hypothetical protein